MTLPIIQTDDAFGRKTRQYGGMKRTDVTKAVIFAGLLGLASPAVQAEALFVSCDNGLRCVRAPCPSRDVVLLPSGQRYARTGPQFEGLSKADLEKLNQGDGLYDGTLVLGGTIDEGPPVRVVARRVVRQTTPREATLCRRQARR